MGFIQIIDILFKIIGSIAAVIAILQLYEIKKKRNIDMYWKIFDLYNETGTYNRRAFNQISVKMDKLKTYLSDSSHIDKQEIISEYKIKFHDASNDSEEKEIDTKARRHISFLNQTAILLRKGLIDKDMLLGLIGAGFEIDYPVLEIVLMAHRQAHSFQEMYGGIGYLLSQYEQWKHKSKW